MRLERVILENAFTPAEKGVAILDYKAFKNAYTTLSDNKSIAKYLSPIMFMKLSAGSSGFVLLSTLMNFINKKIQIERLSVQLEMYDSEGKGYLDESQLENFIYDTIPSLYGLRNIEPEFVEFYVMTAVRKFMFFLDIRNTGKIAIGDIVLSDMIHDFLSLRNEDYNPRSWFALEYTKDVYERYLFMDEDMDGMLSRHELRNYSGAQITRMAVDRVFAECPTYDGLLDYKGYLDLVLSIENPAREASVRYFWRLLDVDKTGKVGYREIHGFLDDVIKRLDPCCSLQYTSYSPLCLFDEMLDMMSIPTLDYMTLKDALKYPKVGGVVLHMLIDAQGFYNHDNRENLLHTANS
jgi:serine/threonine-protein phosphatase 2A regulatory subunit B''